MRSRTLRTVLVVFVTLGVGLLWIVVGGSAFVVGGSSQHGLGGVDTGRVAQLGEEREVASKDSQVPATHTSPSRDPLADEPLWDHDKSEENVSLRVSSAATAVRAIRQCEALGPDFTSFLSEYLVRCRTLKSRLIYSCQSDKEKHFCGGMGDRFRGMISTFFLALVTNRRFELFHPAPAPIQTHLLPNLVNWIPTTSSTASSAAHGGRGVNFALEVLREMESIDVNMLLMRLQGHKKFVQWLLGQSDRRDLRIQSNTFGIDPFLHRVQSFRTRITDTMKLPLTCNLTCYYGCLYHVLFRPSQQLWRLARETFGLPLDHVSMTAPQLPAFISLQVRMGGSWAPGMRVAEPFRTHPDAIPHFIGVLRELRGSAAHSNFPDGLEESLRGAPIFVSSDSKKFVDRIIQEFGNESVFYVHGDAYRHTDTLNLGDLRPYKFSAYSKQMIQSTYFLSLLSHVILERGLHMVMAQSGFGDTAFWAMRHSATCIFVDMRNNRLAWQHHQSYPRGSNASAAIASRNRVIDIRKPPTTFYTDG